MPPMPETTKCLKKLVGALMLCLMLFVKPVKSLKPGCPQRNMSPKRCISLIGTTSAATLSTLCVVSPALAANDADTWFPNQQQQGSATTSSSKMRFIKNTQALQDDRLSQCAPKGKNWEQCFFYGTDTQGANAITGKFLSTPPKKQIKQGVPTW